MESNGNHQNGHGKSIHLLMVPMILQAQAVTGFRFSKKIAKRGVTVTLVMIKKHADELYRLHTLEGLQKLGINVEVLDTYQPPQISSPLTESEAVRQAFQPMAQKLITRKLAALPGFTCLLADRFLWWIPEMLKELDIPRYTYNSTAAMTLRLMLSNHEHEDELKAIPKSPNWLQKSYEVLGKTPGLECLVKATDVPEISAEDGWLQFLCEVGRAFSTADGIVLNTIYALEHEVINHIGNAYAGNTAVKVPPVYTVGPLSTVEEFENETFVGGLEDSHTECVEWLGTQPSKSVLFMCLGSSIRLFGKQISHIAHALDSSQQKFLWVLSKGRGNFNTLDEVLPVGYLERVSGRGKIVTGWVGQLEILSNPAIRGFLSHCGWQSIFESMTYGVPVLGWPHIAEQRLNCRYMQEVLKVGVRVTEKESWELVQQHEFEEAIKSFMSEEGRAVIAANAAKVKELATAAVAQGGPSDKSLDRLIESFSRRRFSESCLKA